MPIDPFTAAAGSEIIKETAKETAKETVKETFKEIAKEGLTDAAEVGSELEAAEATELLEAETAALNETKTEVSPEFAEAKEQIQGIVDLIKSFEFNFESFISDPEYMISKIGEANTYLKELSTKFSNLLETDYVKDLMESLNKIDKVLKEIQSSGSIDFGDEDESLEGFADSE